MPAININARKRGDIAFDRRLISAGVRKRISCLGERGRGMPLAGLEASILAATPSSTRKHVKGVTHGSGSYAVEHQV
jgi:hypothetical protein